MQQLLKKVIFEKTTARKLFGPLHLAHRHFCVTAANVAMPTDLETRDQGLLEHHIKIQLYVHFALVIGRASSRKTTFSALLEPALP